MHEIEAGHKLEQFTGDVLRAADAGRCHIDLAGIGFGILDEFRHRLGRKVRQNFHDQRNAEYSGNRRDIAHEVERKIGKQRGIDRVLRIDQKQRVAIRRRAHDQLGRDIAGRARTHLDDKLLSEMLRKILRDEPGGDVGRTRGRLADDHLGRAGRIIERHRAAVRERHRSDGPT
jgi:hypothetical protein